LSRGKIFNWGLQRKMLLHDPGAVDDLLQVV